MKIEKELLSIEEEDFLSGYLDKCIYSSKRYLIEKNLFLEEYFRIFKMTVTTIKFMTYENSFPDNLFHSLGFNVKIARVSNKYLGYYKIYTLSEYKKKELIRTYRLKELIAVT